MSSISAIIIGNEVLTAKVVDANGAHLVKRAHERGLRVESIHLVRDDIDHIVETLMLARRRADVVITSGGVGPTHDDVTVRAVSLALGRRVERLTRLEGMLREAWHGEPPPEAFRMAEAPAGTTLLECADTRFPVLACDGVFMLPGVPDLFRLQLEAVFADLPGNPVELGVLYVSAHESDIAHALDVIALSMPDISFGSYPSFEHEGHWRVKLTVEHASRARVDEALARLRSELPTGCIVANRP